MPRPQLAIAARDAPVPGRAGAGGNRLPARAFAQWAKRHLSCGQLFPDPSHLDPSFDGTALTLHLNAGFPQARSACWLCTTCEGVIGAVEDGGKTRCGRRFLAACTCGCGSQPLVPSSHSTTRGWGVRNRLRTRIFTVDIPRRERRIRPVRFPHSATAFVLPVSAGHERDLRGETNE